MNRWTAPLVTASLLAAPAVLVGWNATSWAGAVVRPWTTGPEQSQGAGHSLAPVNAPVADPTTAQIDTPGRAGQKGPVAPSSGTRTVVIVHNRYPQTVEDDVSHQDDQRGTDSGPEPHPDASPVPITDPELVPQPEPAPDEEPSPEPSPAPGTPERQPLPEVPDNPLNP